MSSPDDKRDRDPKIKDVLSRGATPLDQMVDADTAAELQRWFGLPSFTQLAEEPELGLPVQDEMREARDRAAAHVRPDFLAAMIRRSAPPEAKFQATIEPIDADIALFDPTMLEHGILASGERELEVPEPIVEAMRENTPQALLRDLHRTETFFEKGFELVDYGAEQRLDIVETVRSAMATPWRLPLLDQSPAMITLLLFQESRAIRRRSWDTLHKDPEVEDMSAWAALTGAPVPGVPRSFHLKLPEEES